ncbi:helix-turn-helix domain-containing protein [Neolewinella antarctica]|uniref:Transcriptional regulator with XRE-family HTH domain n=1 Tax=Neolewinella antarctica TaxID=442734 RepID=A0ABX0XE32_9BACT|nr:helix-turn-helix transcriptional regulator [Neolewinella antarctica]NJC27017.1 transcriptional regulator with XRE-family HTH domain [Neolewinella antarctica]
MAKDKLRQYLNKHAKPAVGWQDLVDDVLNDDRDERRFKTSVNYRVLEYLDRTGMKRQDFAEKAGMLPQALSRILKGKQDLRVSTLLKLEKALGEPLIKVLREPNREENPIIRQPSVVMIVQAEQDSFTQVTGLDGLENLPTSNYPISRVDQLLYGGDPREVSVVDGLRTDLVGAMNLVIHNA